MKVVDIKIIEKTSKQGNKYLALYAVLENGKELLIRFVPKSYAK